MERPTTSTKRVTTASTASTASTAIAERLPPEHLAWLKEFSVVMHRRYAYPPKHPSRVAAEEAAFAALSNALEHFPEIAITVARTQLAIGDGFSDPKNPALCELAERFHRQGIGAITVRDGMTREEFDALLTRIVEARSGDDAASDDTSVPLGDHVALSMMRYEGLALSDEEDDNASGGSDASSERLWRELADATLSGWDGEDGDGGGGGASGSTSRAPTPSGGVERTAEESLSRLATAINRRSGDKQFASKVLESMIRVGRQSRKRGRTGSGAVAARLRAS